MKMLQTLWEDAECPILNGVMFAEGFADQIQPFDQPRPPGIATLTVERRIFLGSYAKLQVAGVVPLCRSEDRLMGLVAVAGEGGLGADGFLAVTDMANFLRWIAFFDFSNPFVRVELKGGKVLAENNLGEKWRIALAIPSRIVVEVPTSSGRRTR